MTRMSYIAGAVACCATVAVAVAAAAGPPANAPIDPAPTGPPPARNRALPSQTPRAAPASSSGSNLNPPQPDVTASLRMLSPNFEILRRAPVTDTPATMVWNVTASNGDVMRIHIDGRGLCLDSDGGTACGDPGLASTTATVAHALPPQGGEQIAGIVPDGVSSVRIRTTRGESEDAPVRDNVFSVRLEGSDRSSAVLWVDNRGAAVQQVP